MCAPNCAKVSVWVAVSSDHETRNGAAAVADAAPKRWAKSSRSEECDAIGVSRQERHLPKMVRSGGEIGALC